MPENPDENRKRGVTNKRVSNRKLKMELGYQFKYPNFRTGYTAEILRLERARRTARHAGRALMLNSPAGRRPANRYTALSPRSSVRMR